MNIKALLLASAGITIAAPFAHAADAVIAEPEPANYVRVCDVFGEGYFYIPGTETCLQVSGYLRYDTVVAGKPAVNLEGDEYQVSTAVRTRLNFDAREMTDLGTLRAYVRLQNTNFSGTANEVEIDQAFLQLGGLLAGYRDSMWSSDIGGIEDGLLGDTDLVVGDFNTNQISYTIARNGFSGTIGLEDDGTGDVVPDVHAKLVYSGAFGGAFLSAVYDESFSQEDVNSAFGQESFLFNGVDTFPVFLPGIPTLLEDGGNDAFALKAGLLIENPVFADSRIKFEGHYAFDPTVYAVIPGLATTQSFSVDNPNVLNPTPGALPIFLEWAVGVGYAQAVGPVGVSLSAQYGETFDTSFFGRLPNGDFGTFATDGEYQGYVANVGYEITPKLASLAEVTYKRVDFDQIGDTDQVTGFLRLQRDF